MKVLGKQEPAGQATGRRALHQRWSVRGLAVIAITATAGLGIVAPGGAASAASSTAQLAKLGTHYYVDKRECATAKINHASCMAIRAVPSSASNPNARSYPVNASFPVGPSGGLTPGDFAAAYGFDADSVVGSTQTVGIVDAFNDPNITSDLNAFDKYYSYPAETADTFEVVGQTGSTTALPGNDKTGWSGEEALDVETVRGVCHTCKIILVEANNTSNANLSTAVDTAVHLGATEVSNSYGGAEGGGHPSKAQLKAIEKPYNHKGVVITASTGDDGWFSWDGLNSGKLSADAPNIPSSLPQVVSVGGTKLNLNADATRKSESVWNENGKADNTALKLGVGALGATGGGCSRYFKAEGWQANVAGYKKTGCGKTRLAADVSADADPASGYDTYDTYDCGTKCEPLPVTGWQPVGGTSLSSPLIAAMWALAGGAGGVDYPALSLYGHLSSAKGSLYDVTKGGNSWCDADAKCSAHTYKELQVRNPNDLAFNNGKTPIGTVDCAFKSKTAKPTKIKDNHQCNAAKGYDGPSGVGTPKGLSGFKPLTPKATIKYSTAKVKQKVTFSVGGKDPFPGAKYAQFKWDIAGTKTGGAKPVVVFKKAGTYAVTVTATDSYGQTASAQANVTVKN